MTTTDHAAAIAAAEARLAAAQADVERLRAQLAEETAASTAETPKLATWADGVAAARKRHSGRTRSGTAAGDFGKAAEDAREGTDITSVAGARAEAGRRAAARLGRGGDAA